MSDLRVGLVVGARLDASLQKAMRRASGGLRELEKEASSLRREQEKLGQQRKLVASLRDLRAATLKSARELDHAKREAGRLSEEFKKTDAPTKKMTKALESARKRASRLSNALDKGKSSLKEKTAEAEKAGISVRSLTREDRRLADRERELARHMDKKNRELKESKGRLRSVTDETKRLERAERSRQERLGRLSEERGRIRGAAVGLGVAAGTVGLLARGSLRAGDTEARLRTVLPQTDQANALFSQIDTYLRDNRGDRAELIGGAYQGLSGGLNAEEAFFAARRANEARYAMGGDARVSEVGGSIISAYNAFGDRLEGDVETRMSKLADLITATQQTFSLENFNQLGEGMKYASIQMKSFGIELEQGYSLIGRLNTEGITGSQAGTAFNAMMRNITKAERELGFDIARNDSGGVDIVETLRRLDKALGGFEEGNTEQIDILQKVFGDGNMGLIPLLSSLDKIVADEEQLRSGMNGAVARGFAFFNESLSGEMDKFNSVVAEAGRLLGDSFLPAITGVASVVTPMIGGFSDLMKSEDGTANAGAKIAGTVAVGGLGIGGAYLGGMYLRNLLQTGSTKLGGLGGMLGGGASTAVGVATGKALEATTGVQSVYVVNMPSGGLAGGAGPGGDTATTVSQGGLLSRGLARTRGALAKGAGGLRGLSTGAKALGGIGTALLVGESLYQAGSALNNDELTGQQKAGEVGAAAGGLGGGLGGAAAGALVGASIGSAVPIIGTAIGAAIGAGVGGFGGHWLGDKAGRGTGEWLWGDDSGAHVEKLSDGVVRDANHTDNRATTIQQSFTINAASNDPQELSRTLGKAAHDGARMGTNRNSNLWDNGDFS